MLFEEKCAKKIIGFLRSNWIPLKIIVIDNVRRIASGEYNHRLMVAVGFTGELTGHFSEENRPRGNFESSRILDDEEPISKDILDSILKFVKGYLNFNKLCKIKELKEKGNQAFLKIDWKIKNGG